MTINYLGNTTRVIAGIFEDMDLVSNGSLKHHWLCNIGLAIAFCILTLIPSHSYALQHLGLQHTISSGPVRDNLQDFNQLFGWPRQMDGRIPMWGRCPTLIDFDGNGDWELSILTSEGMVNTYQHDGANYPGFPSRTHQGDRPAPWVNPSHNSTFAIIDIAGDGADEIVFLSDLGFLHVIDHEGNEPEPFPIDVSRDMKAGVPAVADLNNNDSQEIIFNSYSSHVDSINADGWIHVMRGIGRELEGWPVSYRSPSASSPVTGDISDGDELEIVIGNARRLDNPAQIFAWRPDGSLVENFPIGAFETIRGAPALADLTGDGKLEIIIWANSVEDEGAGIYAYNGNGELLEGYPLDCAIGHPEGNPAIADITGDDSPEIVFGNFNHDDGPNLYAWSSDGEVLEGFPVDLNATIAGSITLVDVSGDRVSDIVVVLAPTEGEAGAITALSGDAETIDGFPLSMDRWGNSVIAGTPSLWDIDRDRDLELIAVTTDRRILIWDTPGLIGDDVWLTFKGEMHRTGRRPADIPNAIRIDKKPDIPYQFSLSMYPNPFNSEAQFSLTAHMAGNVHLELFNIEGRSLGAIYNGKVEVGKTQISLTADEFKLTAGLYFCKVAFNNQSLLVRVVYIP